AWLGAILGRVGRGPIVAWALAGRLRIGIVVGPRLLAGRVVQLLLVHAGGVERVAAAPVRQRQQGRDADVLAGHRVPAVPRRVRGGGPGDHDVGPQAVHVEAGAHPGDPLELLVAEDDRGQAGLGGGDGGGQRGLVGGEPRRERRRGGVEAHPPAHHLGPGGG